MHEEKKNLSLSEILDLLNSDNALNRRCFLLDELGVICQNGKDENEVGEKCLLTTLEHADVSDRLMAFRGLSLIPGAKEKYATEMGNFRTNPKNAKLLSFIEKPLSE